jgi:hypothetical protein
MTDLLLRRVPERRPGADGQDDYDVVGAAGLVVGRIFKATTSPAKTPWMWNVAYGNQEDRSQAHGYEPTLGAAMAVFRRRWDRQGE